MRETRTAPQSMRVRRRVPMTLAALVGVELEHIADQQHKHGDEEQEGDDGKADEDDDLAGGAGLRKLG